MAPKDNNKKGNKGLRKPKNDWFVTFLEKKKNKINKKLIRIKELKTQDTVTKDQQTKIDSAPALLKDLADFNAQEKYYLKAFKDAGYPSNKTAAAPTKTEATPTTTTTSTSGKDAANKIANLILVGKYFDANKNLKHFATNAPELAASVNETFSKGVTSFWHTLKPSNRGTNAEAQTLITGNLTKYLEASTEVNESTGTTFAEFQTTVETLATSTIFQALVTKGRNPQAKKQADKPKETPKTEAAPAAKKEEEAAPKEVAVEEAQTKISLVKTSDLKKPSRKQSKRDRKHSEFNGDDSEDEEPSKVPAPVKEQPKKVEPVDDGWTTHKPKKTAAQSGRGRYRRGNNNYRGNRNNRRDGDRREGDRRRGPRREGDDRRGPRRNNNYKGDNRRRNNQDQNDSPQQNNQAAPEQVEQTN